MSDVDLQAYLELADKATPGPWEANHRYGAIGAAYAQCLGHINGGANLEFIALSRTVGPDAARRALAAEAEVRQLDSAFEGLCASFKTGIEMFEEQYKLYTKRIDKLQADLLASQQREAALREALAKISTRKVQIERAYCADVPVGYVRCPGCLDVITLAAQALALTPAAASDRMAKLERVAEAARVVVQTISHRHVDPLKALAELDGEANAEREAATNEAMHTGDYTGLAELGGDSPK